MSLDPKPTIEAARGEALLVMSGCLDEVHHKLKIHSVVVFKDGTKTKRRGYFDREL